MAMRSGAHEGLTCPLEKGVRGIEKESILENPSHIVTNLFLNAY